MTNNKEYTYQNNKPIIEDLQNVNTDIELVNLATDIIEKLIENKRNKIKSTKPKIKL